MPYYGFYFDPTYLLVLIGVVLCMIASARVKTTYKKYEKVGSRSGYTADQVAYMILRKAGITDVSIHHISGDLTDNTILRSIRSICRTACMVPDPSQR